jgi:hypothetical protein
MRPRPFQMSWWPLSATLIASCGTAGSILRHVQFMLSSSCILGRF